jgi:hypothetical protein
MLKNYLFSRTNVKFEKSILGRWCRSDFCIATFSPEVFSNYVRVTFHFSVKFTSCRIFICPKKLSILCQTDSSSDLIRKHQSEATKLDRFAINIKLLFRCRMVYRFGTVLATVKTRKKSSSVLESATIHT